MPVSDSGGSLTITVEPIQDSDIETVTSVLVNAFYTNPAYASVFKYKLRLKDGLHWLFRASLLINNQKQPLTMVVKEKSTGEVIGTFTLIPPQGVKKSVSIYTKIGIGSFVLKFGIGTLIRMLGLEKKNKSLLTESMGESGYYYLSMVVIKEEYRGKGVGSLVLKQAINNLVESSPMCRAIGLTTQLPENVVFYSRLGFNKLDEGYVLFKGSKYYNYNMKYNLTR